MTTPLKSLSRNQNLLNQNLINQNLLNQNLLNENFLNQNLNLILRVLKHHRLINSRYSQGQMVEIKMKIQME